MNTHTPHRSATLQLFNSISSMQPQRGSPANAPKAFLEFFPDALIRMTDACYFVCRSSGLLSHSNVASCYAEQLKQAATERMLANL